MEEETFAKLLLGQYISSILAEILSLMLFSFLLLDKTENSFQWFPMLYVFMTCGALFPVGGITYLGYLIVYWNPIQVQYDSNIMYITGIFHISFLLAFPLMIVFLVIDRILFNFWKFYEFTYQLAFSMLSISSSIFLALVIIIVDFLPRIRFHFTTKCRCLGCLFSNSDTYLIIRFIISITILFFTIIFYLIVKQKINGTNSSIPQTNRLIFRTLLIAIIFDTIPYFFVFLGLNYYRHFLQQFGSYSTFLGSMMAMLCAILHWQTIRGFKICIFNRTSPLNSQIQGIQREIR